nr:TPA_inf: conotoxin precursor J [Conus judaeus]
MQPVQSVTRCCLLLLLLSALCVSPHPLGISQPVPQQLNSKRMVPKDFDPCKKLCVGLNPPANCQCSGTPDVVETTRTKVSTAP